MRLLLSIAFCAALLSSGAVFASPAPCNLATTAEVERILGGPAVSVPASEIGEETAPSCLWASAGRRVEVKLSIWSRDELAVLGIADAEGYFVKLKAEYAAQGPVNPLAGLGERAFEAGFAPMATLKANGAVVVLKAGRVIVLEFANVSARDARMFAARVVARS